jgi:ATP-dependent protease HslVU (ClpYQ) peptidase subunit
MSVVAAAVRGGRAVIGSDREEHSETAGLKWHGRSKIVRARAGVVGQVLIGIVGESTLANRVRLYHSIEALPDNSDDRDCDRWADAVAGAIYSMAKTDYGERAADLSTGEDDLPDYEGLLVWEDKLWTLEPTGDAIRVLGPYEAIGSGASVAVGAMHAATSDNGWSPDRVVRAGLAAANHHASDCGGGYEVCDFSAEVDLEVT